MQNTTVEVNEKAAIGAVMNQITKAMNAAAAGAEGVEGAPVVLAHNPPFYIVVICTKTTHCETSPDKCKRCKCETIQCQLEVMQTADSAEVAQKLEDAAVDGLYQLVHRAMTAMKLDFAEKKNGD